MILLSVIKICSLVFKTWADKNGASLSSPPPNKNNHNTDNQENIKENLLTFHKVMLIRHDHWESGQWTKQQSHVLYFSQNSCIWMSPIKDKKELLYLFTLQQLIV